MNRQRGLLLAVTITLFFAVSSWMIYNEILLRQSTFITGAPTQDIKDVIIHKELAASELRPPALRVSDPIRYGSVSSAASIIEYGDYQCETCKTMSPILSRIAASYKGNVRLVWRDFPITTLHPKALDAAVFARCAGLEGKYWEAHDALFAADEISEYTMSKIADQLKLNINTLTYCRNDKTLIENILRDTDVAQGDGISRAPTIFVGTKAFIGTVSEEVLRAAIEQFLKS